MRPLTAMALTLAAVLFLDHDALAAAQKALRAREAEKLIKEYSASETTVERKTEIEHKLRTAKPKTLAASATQALKRSGTRMASLELIASLPIPNMFKALKKYAGGETESSAINAMFVSGGKGCEEFLLHRWRDLSLEDRSFEIVDAAFRTHYVSAKTVGELRKIQTHKKSDTARRERVPPILVFQMDLDVEQAKTLEDKWAEHFKKYSAMNQRLPIQGRDLLKQEWTSGFGEGDENEEQEKRVRKYRGKYRIENLGVLQLKGITWKSGTVRLRVMIIEGDGATIGVMMKGNAMVGPRYSKGTWLLTQSIRTAEVESAPFEWVELTFKLSGSNLIAAIGGKQIGATNQYGSQINGIYLTSGRSKMLLGSAELFD